MQRNNAKGTLQQLKGNTVIALSRQQWFANARQYCYTHIACIVHTRMSCL
jgi:hypothetical protein